MWKGRTFGIFVVSLTIVAFVCVDITSATDTPPKSAAMRPAAKAAQPADPKKPAAPEKPASGAKAAQPPPSKAAPPPSSKPAVKAAANTPSKQSAKADAPKPAPSKPVAAKAVAAKTTAKRSTDEEVTNVAVEVKIVKDPEETRDVVVQPQTPVKVAEIKVVHQHPEEKHGKGHGKEHKSNEPPSHPQSIVTLLTTDEVAAPATNSAPEKKVLVEEAPAVVVETADTVVEGPVTAPVEAVLVPAAAVEEVRLPVEPQTTVIEVTADKISISPNVMIADEERPSTIMSTDPVTGTVEVKSVAPVVESINQPVETPDQASEGKAPLPVLTNVVPSTVAEEQEPQVEEDPVPVPLTIVEQPSVDIAIETSKPIEVHLDQQQEAQEQPAADVASAAPAAQETPTIAIEASPSVSVVVDELNKPVVQEQTLAEPASDVVAQPPPAPSPEVVIVLNQEALKSEVIEEVPKQPEQREATDGILELSQPLSLDVEPEKAAVAPAPPPQPQLLAPEPVPFSAPATATGNAFNYHLFSEIAKQDVHLKHLQTMVSALQELIISYGRHTQEIRNIAQQHAPTISKQPDPVSNVILNLRRLKKNVRNE